MVIHMKNDYILIRVDEAEEKRGSIILVDSARNKNRTTGVVIAAFLDKSIDKQPIKLRVAVGDRVLFFDGVGRTITWEGEDILVMKSTEVLGVISK